MFTGSMVALVTPFTQQGELDLDALSRLIDIHIEQGSNALVVAGTTGESSTLSKAEYESLIKHSHKLVAGRIALIVGTSANATQEAIAKTRFAMEVGVDACLIMTPAYIKPTQEGLYQHYAAIAEAAAIPQILYNVPGRTACDLLPETIARLAHIPNIIGVKEATAEMGRVTDILNQCGDKLDIYSGDDASALALMLLGGKGVISVTANAAPKLMSEMCQAVHAGALNQARSINSRLHLLHKQLFVEANPIAVKYAVSQLGWCQNVLRLPLTPLSEHWQAPLTQTMKTIGLL